MLTVQIQNEFSTTSAAFREPSTTLQPVALQPAALVSTPSALVLALTPTLISRILYAWEMSKPVSLPSSDRSCSSMFEADLFAAIITGPPPGPGPLITVCGFVEPSTPEPKPCEPLTQPDTYTDVANL